MNGRSPWPLARGIAVGITVLTAVVLVVAGLIVTAALRTFLLDRVDQQAATLVSDAGGLAREAAGDRPPLPAGAIVVTTTTDGEVTAIRGAGAPDVSLTSLPEPLRASRSALPTDAVIGDKAYRVVAGRPADADDLAFAVVALPLGPVEETIERLVWIELAVGAVALLTVALGGYAVARSRLRPLGRISTEARGIAEVDLLDGDTATSALRLPPVGGSAEVVDLTAALNAMLARIDAALSARAEAQARLRRFVADASHELRTPLASIRGYAELTRRGMAADADAAAMAAGRIEAEATRMGVLVDDLLLLARLDQGRPLELTDVDLGDLARRCVADSSVGDGGRAIDVDVPEHAVVVRGDQDRLQQVVVNLLANAVSHTPGDTPVTVTVRQLGDRARLSVADRGPGIPEPHRDKVFEPFYRVDAGRSRDRGGSGLGLSIVASIVAAHGGDVVLDTGPNGTTVTVDLPAGTG